MRTVRIRDTHGERLYRGGDFPLIAGGAGAADVELPGLAPGERVGVIGLADGTLYWQDARPDGAPIDGAASARWLAPGDVIVVGQARLRCEQHPEGVILSITPAATAGTFPPDPEAEGTIPTRDAGVTDAIAPAEYRPMRGIVARERRSRRGSLVLGAGLVVFAAVVWLLVSARVVGFDVTPEADDISVTGGLAVPFGDQWLMRPGHYEVVASKAGYAPRRAEIEVTDEEGQRFALALEKLPGRLRVETPAPQAEAFVDGKSIGTTPAVTELAPGQHQLVVRAPRYLESAQEITIEGGGVEQPIEVVLEPGWADVLVQSEPAGAELRVDGVAVGTTPLTAQIDQGQRELELKLAGYKVWRQPLTVQAGVEQKLAPVALVKADGLIDVRSSPSGAAVTVDGRYRGETPLELELAPGRSYRVALSKAGYAPVTRTVEPVSGEDRDLVVTLEGVMGTVRVVSDPPDADVYVDGALRGRAPQSLELTAIPHRIELRKPGYATQTSMVTPRPGYDQQVTLTLQTEQSARSANLEPKIKTKAGQELVLVRSPGQFEMGASRREPGRRANETLYEVRLQRSFYIGTKEVTNAQYRRFQAKHNSGSRDNYGLDDDDQPVVRVSWADAARYCNWLSAQEGLEPAYVEANGKMFPAQPMTRGYRLPTEAEWTWVARYASGKEPVRYSWGNDMPPTPKAGNFADQSARSMVRDVIEGYDDGYPGTAPVGTFPANALGLYDLGGNAAEWMHDRYAIEVSSGFDVLVDPLGPAVGELHSIRGSSYLHGDVGNLRLTFRDNGTDARDDVGFRLARYAD